MKKLHIPLLCLLSLSGFAQDIGNRKVDIGNVPSVKSQNVTIDQLKKVEGYQLNGGQILYTSGVSSSTSIVNITNYLQMPGRISLIDQINLQASKACMVQVYVNDGWTGAKTPYGMHQIAAGGQLSLSVDITLHGNQNLFIYLQPNTDMTGLVISGTIRGYDMIEDYNWNAQKSIFYIGDSITYGSLLGAFTTYNRDDIWWAKVLNYYRDKGEDVRPTMDAVVGINTTQLDRRRQGGAWDRGVYPSVIFYFAGVNNTLSTGGTSQANLNQIAADYASVIAQKKARYPKSKLVMISPVPTQNAGREADLVLVRGLMATAVTNGGGTAQSIYYVDNTGIWTPTDATKYNGDGLHPTVAANQLLYNNIKTILDASVPTLPAN